MRRRWGRPVAALVAAGTLLTACGSPARTSTGAAGGGQSIVVYSGQHEQTTQELVSAFEKQSGDRVKVRFNDEDALGNEIIAEEAHPRADVFYTENTPVLALLARRHLLAPLPMSILSATPARYDDPSGAWVGVSARVSVLVYNPKLIAASDLPTTVLALADPTFRGKVGIAAGETDFQPVVIAVAQRYGAAAAVRWLKGLAANAGARQYGSNEALVDEINRGAVAVGLVNQYYWYRLGAEIGRSHLHSEIAYLAPHDPGYVVDVSAAAVLASSRHQATAEKFVRFLASPTGQHIIGSSLSFEYPISSGVTTAEPERPLAALQPDALSLSSLGDGSTALALLKRAGLS